MTMIAEQTIQTNRYPAYKDSGVNWLGEIPAHWEVRRVKFLFKEKNVRSLTGLEELLSLSKYHGVIPRKELTDKVESANSLINYKTCSKGDLIINKLQAWNGMLDISKYDGIVSPDYSVYQPLDKNINKTFYKYLFRTPSYIGEFTKNSSGIGDGFFRLYTDGFFGIWSVFPPLAEQTRIAEFLDRKTAQIDQAIAQKERLIELLNEQRQVMIHRAVTRGLNPNVPMKDSGVDWIGEIPVHWKVKKLKYLTSKIGSGITPSGGATSYLESGIPLLRSQNILWGKIDYDGVAYISEATHKSMGNSHVKNGDVLLNITGASIGRCHYVENNIQMNVNQHVCIIRPTREISSIFLNNLLSSEVGQGQIWSFQQGGGREGLNFQAIKNFFIPLPPQNEQKKITEYLTLIAKKIESISQSQHLAIQKLRELKSTLINSAVTGKIKV